MKQQTSPLNYTIVPFSYWCMLKKHCTPTTLMLCLKYVCSLFNSGTGMEPPNNWKRACTQGSQEGKWVRVKLVLGFSYICT